MRGEPKKCTHPNIEPELQAIDEGHFKYWYCPDCKYKSYIDYVHEGGKFEHEGFPLEEEII